MDLNDLKRLVAQSRSFPTLPAVITRLLQVINNPESSAKDVAAIVKHDQSLTANLLRLVNSAAYGLGSTVTSIEETISLLGFGKVTSLSVGVAVMDTFQIQEFNMRDFWRHTIAVSMAAKFLAERTGYRKAGEVAATLGLIHDVGKLAFMIEIPEKYKTVVYQARTQRDISVFVEKEVLGVDHCQAGYLLAQRWQWPKIYQDVLLYHHAPKNSKVSPVINFFVFLGNFASHVALDPEYKSITFSQVLQFSKVPDKLQKLCSKADWNACLSDLLRRQDEIHGFVEIMV